MTTFSWITRAVFRHPLAARTQRELASWSAAIVNFNGHNLVCETIASLNATRHPPNEILMVDDGATDDRLAIVRMRHPDVQILPMPDHTGYPGCGAQRGSE